VLEDRGINWDNIKMNINYRERVDFFSSGLRQNPLTASFEEALQ
jgi:hypothetical protein